MLTPELDKMINELNLRPEPMGHTQVLAKEYEGAAEGQYDYLMLNARDDQQRRAASNWYARTLRQLQTFKKLEKDFQ